MFTDQVAVITGASSGIGKAIALELAAQGAQVCLLGRNLEMLKDLNKSIPATAPQALCYQVDLTVDEDIQNFKKRIEQKFGQIDLLIHSAGVISLGEIKSAPVEDFDWQYRINVRAPYVLTQAMLPLLMPRKGQIVFINSLASLYPKAGVGQYAATKSALKAIADCLRAEVNSQGLRVLTVFPGSTASPMQKAVQESLGKTFYPERFLQPHDVATTVINAIGLPRNAEVTELQIRPFVNPN